MTVERARTRLGTGTIYTRERTRGQQSGARALTTTTTTEIEACAATLIRQATMGGWGKKADNG